MYTCSSGSEPPPIRIRFTLPNECVRITSLHLFEDIYLELCVRRRSFISRMFNINGVDYSLATRAYTHTHRLSVCNVPVKHLCCCCCWACLVVWGDSGSCLGPIIGTTALLLLLRLLPACLRSSNATATRCSASSAASVCCGTSKPFVCRCVCAWGRRIFAEDLVCACTHTHARRTPYAMHTHILARVSCSAAGSQSYRSKSNFALECSAPLVYG